MSRLIRRITLITCVVSLAGALSAIAAPTERAPGADDFPTLPLPPEITELHGLYLNLPKGRSVYLDRIVREAEKLGLPAAIADAVAVVESEYDPDALGAAGEVGLMQVLPSTAAMLGHRGSNLQLFEPDTNIRYGVLYLARAWELANGDLCRALMKYRAGHGEERMTPLSARYCARARAYLAAIGSPLANAAGAQITAASEQSMDLSRRDMERPRLRGAPIRLKAAAYQPRKLRTAEDSRRFWAAHEARIRAIMAKLPTSRLRIMSGS
jgi:hypothetical protein